MQATKHSSRCLALTLSADATIAYFSNGTVNDLGYLPEELIGRPVTQILSDHSVFEIQHILDSARKSGCWEGKILFRGREGNPWDAEGTVIPLAGREIRDAGYLLIFRFDEAIRGGIESLDSASGEVGAHLRSIVHELNNPLAVMMGFAQLAILNTKCPQDVRSGIETIYSELQRVAQIVERLHHYGISLQEKAPQTRRISQAS
jgi:signal transduction histidine kinase